jgi:F-type H+-transporting ATPase subunit delta
MQGTSRQALEALQDAVAERLATSSAELGEQLLAVCALLAGQPSLRNALADNGASAQRRASLADEVFTGKVSADVLAVLTEAVRRRWSRPRDLVEALELLGAQALFAYAEDLELT